MLANARLNLYIIIIGCNVVYVYTISHNYSVHMQVCEIIFVDIEFLTTSLINHSNQVKLLLCHFYDIIKGIPDNDTN